MGFGFLKKVAGSVGAAIGGPVGAAIGGAVSGIGAGSGNRQMQGTSPGHPAIVPEPIGPPMAAGSLEEDREQRHARVQRNYGYPGGRLTR